MKRILLCLAVALSLASAVDISSAQLFNKIKNDVKNDVNTGLNAKPNNNTSNNSSQNNNSSQPASGSAAGAGYNAPSGVATSSDGDDIKVYNNYDFVPGQTVIFEDNFMNDQDGEFPAQWKLNSGQGVMNNIAGMNALVLTQGNYAFVSPRIKSPDYLGDAFTIELDYMMTKAGGYGFLIRLVNPKKNSDLHVESEGRASDEHVFGDYPGDHSWQVYRGVWHHVAIAYKNRQLKMYIDQYRVMVDPDYDAMMPASLMIGGIGDLATPVIFTNVRIASGAGMNMIGKKFTDAKIITHGINFDYNKATIKPESMGTLNMILKIMKGDPDVKFEIGGHTDGDGADDYNMTLSQQRADAIRTQLVSMGIDGSRLTARGYGKSKPIADNTSEDGKANNRRVEFVKNP